MFLLVLSHSENFFIVEGLKPGGQFKFLRPLDRLQFSSADSQRHTVTVDPVAGPPVFFRQQFPFLIIKTDPPLMGHFRRDLSVDQRSLRSGLMISGIFCRAIPGIRRIDRLKRNLPPESAGSFPDTYA